MADVYRKTALIEAYHYPFADDVPEYFRESVRRKNGEAFIVTLEGDSYILDDCWVARNPVNGEFWRIDNEVFADTYEKVIRTQVNLQ